MRPFGSSALVKRHIDETGSADVRHRASSDLVFTSRLVEVEAVPR